MNIYPPFVYLVTLCSNHDVFVTNENRGCFQTYYDDENKVIFWGLDMVSI